MKNNDIQKSLKILGLSTVELKLFILLSKIGPVKETELSTKLNISEKKVAQHLKNLCNIGLIRKSVEQPSLLFALPFESALNLLTTKNLEEANSLKRHKKDLLKDWDLL
ncbi:MAG: helix-turn-helix domain-containing protein [Candidatus Bathyarchaeota archaeon]